MIDSLLQENFSEVPTFENSEAMKAYAPIGSSTTQFHDVQIDNLENNSNDFNNLDYGFKEFLNYQPIKSYNSETPCFFGSQKKFPTIYSAISSSLSPLNPDLKHSSSESSLTLVNSLAPLSPTSFFNQQITPANPERRKRKKENNKTAALRYRKKKRIEHVEFLKECEEEEKKNERLKNKVSEIIKEIMYLKGLMQEITAIKS